MREGRVRPWEVLDLDEKGLDLRNWHKRTKEQLFEYANDLSHAIKSDLRSDPGAVPEGHMSDLSRLNEGIAAHYDIDTFRELYRKSGMPEEMLHGESFEKVYKGHRKRGQKNHQKARAGRLEYLKERRSKALRAKEAKVSNKPIDNIAYFDLETTDVSDRPGIYSVGYRIGDNPSVSLFGRTTIPISPGAQKIADLPANKAGLATTNLTEKEMLQQFVGDLKSNKVSQLVGFNSHKFDYGVLQRRLLDFDLKEEASFIERLRHTDAMKTVKANMDQVLSPYKDVIDWDFGKDKVPRGLSLGAIASGLGINIKRAHTVEADVDFTAQIFKAANDPKDFARRFDPLAWAKASDNMAMEKEVAKMGGSFVPDVTKPVNEAQFNAVMNKESTYSRMSNAVAGPMDRFSFHPDSIAGKSLNVRGEAPGTNWSPVIEDDVAEKLVTAAPPAGSPLAKGPMTVNDIKNRAVTSIDEGLVKLKKLEEFVPPAKSILMFGGTMGFLLFAKKMTDDEEQYQFRYPQTMPGNRSGTRDQANRNMFNGYSHTEQYENDTPIGSRYIPRN